MEKGKEEVQSGDQHHRTVPILGKSYDPPSSIDQLQLTLKRSASNEEFKLQAKEDNKEDDGKK